MVVKRKSKVGNPPADCPLAFCMAFLGGAWTPHLLWYLKGDPRRFSELKDDVKGISSKVLAQRLKQLEKDGIVERRIIPSSPPTVEYNLSKFGQRLMPAILSIAEVGRELQAHRQKSGTPATSASA